MSTGAISVAKGKPIGLGRFLAPSFADVLFVMIIAWSFLSSGVGWQTLLMDGDAGFHIRVGDWILENGRVPVEHLFSFSVTGKEWYAFEWLSEALLAGLHTLWGLKGVVLLVGVLIAAVFTVLFRYTVWRGANPFISLFVVLLAVSANKIHFHSRPHVMTWLLLVAAIWLVESDRRQQSWKVWLLVPLVTLWTNLHGGFVIFFVLLALLVAGLVMKELLDTERKPGWWRLPRRYVIVGVLCAGASLINPYGYHLHEHVLEVLGAGWLTSMVDEFQSPSFRSEPMMAFLALLFTSLIITWQLLRRREFSSAFWILMLGYASLVSVRHATIFTLVAAPIIAVELTKLADAAVAASSRRSFLRTLDDVARQFASGASRFSIWPAVFVVGLALAPGVRWPADFPDDLFPTRLVARHSEMLAGSRVFTSDQWGDYLIYRNYPRQKVFIDGQHQYYGPKHIGDYGKILEGNESWFALLTRHRIEVVLCEITAPLATLLRGHSGWREIDRSGARILFARNAP